jgi:hypothetical protein
MSIQALKESLPELTGAKFDQVYRQFFLQALGPVLGFERAQVCWGRLGPGDRCLRRRARTSRKS